MAAKMLKLNVIKTPEVYIRQAVDTTHVQDLRDVILANPEKAYPFHDPIMVRKLPKAEKVKMTMANKPGTAEYELIRGLNRCMALVNEKYTEASAEIVEAGDAEAFAMQFDDPEQGVILKHSLADRNFYIKTLRDKFGWKLADIGARMKLTEASVSRILAEKQAGPKKARKARRKKSKGSTGSAQGAASTNGTTAGFVPAEFFNVLGQLVAAYADNKEAVLAFTTHVDPAVIASTEAMVAEILGNRP